MFGSLPYGLLLLVFALQVKHFICDGPLQTRPMVEAKRVYGNPFGFVHAGLHLIGTAVVLWGFGAPWWLIAVLSGAEGVLHYHIDYTKERIVRSQGWTSSDPFYWWAFTGDQTLHHASYLVIGACAVALL